MDMCIDASIAADVYMLYVSSNGSRYMHARTVRARTQKRHARSHARAHTLLSLRERDRVREREGERERERKRGREMDAWMDR